MGKKVMAGALLAAALTFGAPTDARAGCVTTTFKCIEIAWSLDSYWATLLALDLCQKYYMNCVREQLIGM